jgi:hypothetical protein
MTKIEALLGVILNRWEDGLKNSRDDVQRTAAVPSRAMQLESHKVSWAGVASPDARNRSHASDF